MFSSSHSRNSGAPCPFLPQLQRSRPSLFPASALFGLKPKAEITSAAPAQLPSAPVDRSFFASKLSPFFSHRHPGGAGTPRPPCPTTEHNMAAAAPGPSRTAPPLPTSIRSVRPQARTHTRPFRNRLRAAPPSLSDPHPQSSLRSAPPLALPHKMAAASCAV